MAINSLNQRTTEIVLAAIAFVQVAFRYAQVAVVGRAAMSNDVTERWLVVVQAVLHDGVPLYVPPAVDNKPPLFQYLNLLAGASGNYALGWYAI
ncbi:MAG: hypothetical protein ABEI86_04795, partial [Halobacteriaceae archaeon]